MKTSRTKLKSSFLFTLTLLSASALAKPVAQVTHVNGQVFMISPEGTTKTLKVNDHIEEKSEVLVGEDGNVTLNDYFDSTYHLVEGSHLKLFNKSVQLKSGKTWIQAMGSRHPLALTTANGHVNFWKGEFITTFEQSGSKTQVLVVNGDVEVSNVLEKNMKHVVSGGSFTTLDPEVDNGLPRYPTKVGLTSLNSALAEFKALPEKLKSTESPSRAIASVESEETSAVKKGEILFMTNGKSVERIPASASGQQSAHQYFKKKVARSKASKKTEVSSAPIRIFGMKPWVAPKATPQAAPRVPASVKTKIPEAAPNKIGSDLNIDAEFSNSLRLEKASQPNHPKELENLINDLKSF